MLHDFAKAEVVELGLGVLGPMAATIIWYFVSKTIGRVESGREEVRHLSDKLARQEARLDAAWKSIDRLDKNLEDLRHDL